MPNRNRKVDKYPTIREGAVDQSKLQHMLYAISKFFPLVIWVNLTRNNYSILEYESFTTKKAESSGVFDDLIQVGSETMHPLDKQKFIDTFNRESLLRAYVNGKSSVVLETRQFGDNGAYIWVKTSVIFLNNPENDEVLEITLAQPIEEEKENELENLRLRTILEMTLLGNFEYFSVIDVKDGSYELYAKQGGISHNVPEKGDYNKIQIYIRDTLVPEDKRQAYYENVKLSNVLEKLKENNDYKYRYKLNSMRGQRWYEVAYSYCMSDENEIVMTIRDVHNEVMAEQSKKMDEELQRSRERQQLLTWLGFDIIIDVDLATKTAEILGDAGTFLERDILCENFPMGEIKAGMVHPDDIDRIENVMKFASQNSIFAVDFRYKRGNSYFWCRCRGLILRDSTAKPYRCICKLTDIDEHKRSEQSLMDKAQRDSLTGLYNKATSEQLINEFLSGDGEKFHHALMGIDIDDFKEVNNNWGHQTGDVLLQAFAEILKLSFRSSDIIGRIGGDEFIVFIRDISPYEAMVSAKKLQKRIRSICLDVEPEKYSPVCSIGISMYPDHGKDYSGLFGSGDEAMYEVKRNGKKGVKLYGK